MLGVEHSRSARFTIEGRAVIFSRGAVAMISCRRRRPRQCVSNVIFGSPFRVLCIALGGSRQYPFPVVQVTVPRVGISCEYGCCTDATSFLSAVVCRRRRSPVERSPAFPVDCLRHYGGNGTDKASNADMVRSVSVLEFAAAPPFFSPMSPVQDSQHHGLDIRQADQGGGHF